MSWDGFWAIFERAVFRQQLQRIRVGDEVRRASGGAGGRRLLEAADAWVGDRVRRASSGADGRRLLEHCSHGTQDKFATFSMAKKSLRCFIGACMHGCRCIFCGGILCIDSWYALFGEVVRGCGCWCGMPSSARWCVDVGAES